MGALGVELFVGVTAWILGVTAWILGVTALLENSHLRQKSEN